MKHDHDTLRRAMEIWQQGKHTTHTDVTMRQFIGVFHAVMAAVGERVPVFVAAHQEKMAPLAVEMERRLYDHE